MGYYDMTRQRVTLDGLRIVFHAKAGLESWAEVETAVSLLAENADVQPGARVLLLESGTGALAVWAAQRGGEVHCYDDSLIAARLTRETLAANAVTATVHEAPCPAGGTSDLFDVALLVIPKGRAYTRALLGAACHALKPGGRLYLAGPNPAGAKSVVKDAGLILGRSATIRTRARNRVGVAVRLAGAMGAATPREAYHEFEAAGLRLFGMPGVFSWEELDDGTGHLLDTLDAALCAGRRVLDIGCGYGVLGLAAARYGAAAVDLVDSSWLALDCAGHGIQANGLGAVCRAWASDLYSDVGPEPYDLILSNPPFHAGHAVDTEAAAELIGGARERLAPGGRLRLVANLFLPYDRLLADVFGAEQVRAVYEGPRYRVLEATR